MGPQLTSILIVFHQLNLLLFVLIWPAHPACLLKNNGIFYLSLAVLNEVFLNKIYTRGCKKPAEINYVKEKMIDTNEIKRSLEIKEKKTYLLHNCQKKCNFLGLQQTE